MVNKVGLAFRLEVTRALALIFGLLLAQFASAQVLDKSIQTEERIATNAAQAQAQIDEVVDETESLVSDYRVVLSEIESLRIYNDMLQKTVESQEAEIDNICSSWRISSRPTATSYR